MRTRSSQRAAPAEENAPPTTAAGAAGEAELSAPVPFRRDGGGASHVRGGHLYQATVAAHFPDQASLAQAKEALAALNLPPTAHSVQ